MFNSCFPVTNVNFIRQHSFLIKNIGSNYIFNPTGLIAVAFRFCLIDDQVEDAYRRCCFLTLQVRFEEKNVWLSQKAMAELYQVSVKTINEHIVNIYNENELVPEATIRNFRIVQTEGKREVTRTVDHFNLEAILAVGY
jgi:hypothetical protein